MECKCPLLAKNKLHLFAIIDDLSRNIVDQGVMVVKRAEECLKIFKQAVVYTSRFP